MATIPLEQLLDDPDPSVYDVETETDGPRGRLPLNDALLLERPSGDAPELLAALVEKKVGGRSFSRTELAAEAGVPEVLIRAAESAGLLEPVEIDGEERFSGLIVLDVDLERGISEIGRVDHQDLPGHPDGWDAWCQPPWGARAAQKRAMRRRSRGMTDCMVSVTSA